jgi:hypothetical protein
MRFGQPHANLVIPSKAVGLPQFVLQRGQGRVGDASVDGRGDPVGVERVVYPPRGVRLQPRRDTVAMDAEQARHLLAVPGLAARYEIQRLQALPFLAGGFAFHALMQLSRALVNGGQLLSHTEDSPREGDGEENSKILASYQSETVYPSSVTLGQNPGNRSSRQ